MRRERQGCGAVGGAFASEGFPRLFPRERPSALGGGDTVGRRHGGGGLLTWQRGDEQAGVGVACGGDGDVGGAAVGVKRLRANSALLTLAEDLWVLSVGAGLGVWLGVLQGPSLGVGSDTFSLSGPFDAGGVRGGRVVWSTLIHRTFAEDF